MRQRDAVGEVRVDRNGMSPQSRRRPPGVRDDATGHARPRNARWKDRSGGQSSKCRATVSSTTFIEKNDRLNRSAHQGTHRHHPDRERDLECTDRHDHLLAGVAGQAGNGLNDRGCAAIRAALCCTGTVHQQTDATTSVSPRVPSGVSRSKHLRYPASCLADAGDGVGSLRVWSTQPVISSKNCSRSASRSRVRRRAGPSRPPRFAQHLERGICLALLPLVDDDGTAPRRPWAFEVSRRSPRTWVTRTIFHPSLAQAVADVRPPGVAATCSAFSDLGEMKEGVHLGDGAVDAPAPPDHHSGG